MFLHRKCNWKPVAKAATPASEPTGNRESIPPAKQKYTKAEKAAFKADKQATAEKAEADSAKMTAKSEKRKRLHSSNSRWHFAVGLVGQFCVRPGVTLPGGPKNPGGGVIIHNAFVVIGEPARNVHFEQESWSLDAINSETTKIPFLKQQFAQEYPQA